MMTRRFGGPYDLNTIYRFIGQIAEVVYYRGQNKLTELERYFQLRLAGVLSGEQLLRSADLWLDADDASTITAVGSGVSSWASKGRTALSFSQATASQRPSTGTRTQNGRNVLDFVRANAQYLDAGDVLDLGANSFTLIAAAGFDDTTASTIAGKNVASLTDGRYGLYRASNALVGVYDQDASASGGVSVTDTSLAFRILSQRMERSSSVLRHTLRRDRVHAALKDATDPMTSWNTTAPWKIGRYSSTDPAYYYDLDGCVGDVALFLRALRDVELRAIEDYLAAKWGTA